MSAPLAAEDPEPLEPVPAGTALYVPVRPGPTGPTARFFRTALGGRTAVAFTTEERLRATLGRQPYIRLAEPALRALAEPLGVLELRLDPRLAAPAPAQVPDVPHPAPAGLGLAGHPATGGVR
ncbi:SAV_915 family protein [Actinacidiphila yeochonensis]|uniref:SAV_915 family protein n=1 Tax=Actinacidiphila yeochonensis TaxID=89050 RepID=UPI00055F0895|nr:SAV_915 family protein [Actinacidiphila yeochonensis]